jgi:hypothetical protein
MRRYSAGYRKYHLNFLTALCYKENLYFAGDDMEIVGGFMVMMSIIGFFLAVIWLIMPFVVFAIKGKQDRTLDVLEAIEKRLASLEARLKPVEPERGQAGPTGLSDTPIASSDESSCEHPIEHGVKPTDAAGKSGSEASPAVQNSGGL